MKAAESLEQIDESEMRLKGHDIVGTIPVRADASVSTSSWGKGEEDRLSKVVESVE